MSSQSRARICSEAFQLASCLPHATLLKVADGLAAFDVEQWDKHLQRTLGALPTPCARATVHDFLETWRNCAADQPAASVAMAVAAAAESARAHQDAQSVEVVWTGPGGGHGAFRRTDQALLETIHGATTSLVIVSFAVYKIPGIAHALLAACERGVHLRVIFESPDAGVEKVHYDGFRVLGGDTRRKAEFFVWPEEQRSRTPAGKSGTLHAKCAVADARVLFVSSANLTEHAMTVNMELGLLVRGGRQPRAVAGHFERLIEDGVLTRVN